MTIADRIQTLRKARGISQEELADKVGVSRQAVSKWESEQSTPDLEKVILLSEYFETTTDYLLKGIEPVKEAERRHSALVYAALGTMLNAVGLISAVTVWMERQTAYSVGIGLGFMAVGTVLFFLGQALEQRDREKARIVFLRVNVWTLLLIPASCCFNLFTGLLHGSFGLLAPLPVRSGSLALFGLFWLGYLAVCVTVDLTVGKRKKSEK